MGLKLYTSGYIARITFKLSILPGSCSRMSPQGGISEDCEASYIGETKGSLKAIFLEYRRPRATTADVSKHVDHHENSVCCI